jgi:hypothetical protein
VLGRCLTFRSAAAHPTKCGGTGSVRQRGARRPRSAPRGQQQRLVRSLRTGPAPGTYWEKRVASASE